MRDTPGRGSDSSGQGHPIVAQVGPSAAASDPLRPCRPHPGGEWTTVDRRQLGAGGGRSPPRRSPGRRAARPGAGPPWLVTFPGAGRGPAPGWWCRAPVSGSLPQAPGPHVVDEAPHRDVLREEGRGTDGCHVVPDALVTLSSARVSGRDRYCSDAHRRAARNATRLRSWHAHPEWNEARRASRSTTIDLCPERTTDR